MFHAAPSPPFNMLYGLDGACQESYTAPMSIVAQIAAERRRQGLSISELARRAGLPRPHVSMTLAGKNDAQGSTLDKLAAALGMRLETFRRADDYGRFRPVRPRGGT